MRYVLKGSVRRSSNQLRVNAQLINAESDTHLWAERLDREVSDLFALGNRAPPISFFVWRAPQAVGQRRSGSGREEGSELRS